MTGSNDAARNALAVVGGAATLFSAGSGLSGVFLLEERLRVLSRNVNKFNDLAKRGDSAEDLIAVAKVLPVIGPQIKNVALDKQFKFLMDNLEDISSELVEVIEAAEDLVATGSKVTYAFGTLATVAGVIAGLLELTNKEVEDTPPPLGARGPLDPSPAGFGDGPGDEMDLAVSAADARLAHAIGAMELRHDAVAGPRDAFETARNQEIIDLADKIEEALSAADEILTKVGSAFSLLTEAAQAASPAVDATTKAISFFTTPFDAILSFFEDPPSLPIPVPVLNPFDDDFPGYIYYLDVFPSISRDKIIDIANFISGMSGAVLDFFNPILSPILGPIESAAKSLLSYLDPVAGITDPLSDLKAIIHDQLSEFNAIELELKGFETELKALVETGFPESEFFAGETPVDPGDLKHTFFGNNTDEQINGVDNPSLPSSPDDISGVILSGGGGDDTLFGSLVNDFLKGGDGDDFLAGRNGDDVLDAGWGNDTVYAGNGDDVIYGGFGNDTMYGDYQLALAGDDIFFGGPGLDTVVFKGSSTEYVIEEMNRGFKVSGPEGTDFLSGVEIFRFTDKDIEYEPEIVLFGNQAPTINKGTANAVAGGDAVTIDLSKLGQDNDEGEDGSTLTYTLIDAPVGGAISLLEISLIIDPKTGYETLSKGETVYETVQVTATDNLGAVSDPQKMSFAVEGVNDAPDLIGGVARVGNEEEEVTIDLGSFGSDIDPDDSGASLTYSIVKGPAGGKATLSGSFLNFQPLADFDDVLPGKVRIAKIEVQATDRHGAKSDIEVFRVSVTGAPDQPNNAPSFIGMSPATVTENTAPGTVVGNLFSFDQDGDAVKFSLVKDAGGKFDLENGQITVSGPLNYEESTSETIKVKAEDSFGASTTQRIKIAVLDQVEGTSGRDSLTGTGAADDLNGLGGNDQVYGLGGSDLLRGGSGKDTVLGGNGSDAVLGGGGNDVVKGQGGKDALLGGGGSDLLFGGGGNDVMLGGNGRDVLKGGAGKDMMFGGGGNDKLFGNGGSDLFVFERGYGKDTIMDFAIAGDNDKIDVSDIASIKGFRDLKKNHASNQDGNVVIDDDNGNTITILDIVKADLSGNDFIF